MADVEDIQAAMANTGKSSIPEEEEANDEEELLIIPEKVTEEEDENEQEEDFMATNPYGDEDDVDGGFEEDEGDVVDLEQEEGETKPYQSKLLKPVIRAGNISISLSQAKLFGLVDSSGKRTSRAKRAAQVLDPKKAEADIHRTLGRIKRISDPHVVDLSHIETEDDVECTFKASRTRAATAAMRNPGCGYDFIEKLESEKDGFLARAFGGPDGGATNMERILKDVAEQDYEASQDKLACPECKRFQSFNDFWEKKRWCGQCSSKDNRIRFQKANVMNPATFERRMKEQERLRAERLRKAEKDAYSYEKKVYAKPRDMGGAGIVLPSQQNAYDNGAPAANKMGNENEHKQRAESKRVFKKVGTMELDPLDQLDIQAEAEEKGNGQSLSARGAKGQQDSSSGSSGANNANPEVLLKQLASLNDQKAQLLEATIKASSSKHKAAQGFNKSTNEKSTVGGVVPPQAYASNRDRGDRSISSARSTKSGAGSVSGRSASGGSRDKRAGAGDQKITMKESLKEKKQVKSEIRSKKNKDRAPPKGAGAPVDKFDALLNY